MFERRVVPDLADRAVERAEKWRAGIREEHGHDRAVRHRQRVGEMLEHPHRVGIDGQRRMQRAPDDAAHEMPVRENRDELRRALPRPIKCIVGPGDELGERLGTGAVHVMRIVALPEFPRHRRALGFRRIRAARRREIGDLLHRPLRERTAAVARDDGRGGFPRARERRSDDQGRPPAEPLPEFRGLRRAAFAEGKRARLRSARAGIAEALGVADPPDFTEMLHASAKSARASFFQPR